MIKQYDSVAELLADTLDESSLREWIRTLWDDRHKYKAIVDELDKTEDGVPITPKIPLWQIDRRYGKNSTHGGEPWQCGPGWKFQLHRYSPVFSSSEAALRSVEGGKDG